MLIAILHSPSEGKVIVINQSDVIYLNNVTVYFYNIVQ